MAVKKKVPTHVWERVDKLLRAGQHIRAIMELRAHVRLALHDAVALISARERQVAPELVRRRFEPPTLDELRGRVRSLSSTPRAIQAQWDGDTTGWFVCLEAALLEDDKWAAQRLATIRLGGDMRVFRGAIPPWPEAALATKLGTALAGELGVPFFFPSPDHPDNGCPNWWERDHAVT